MTVAKIENILIAEDDEDDYLLIKEAIEKVITHKIHLRHAKNGSECIKMLVPEEKPDLIFLDLNMPLKNGLEALRLIKSNRAFFSIPVIIFSTSHYLKDIDNCYKEEAHFYIVKPSDPNILSFILKEAIKAISLAKERPSKDKFVIRLENINEKAKETLLKYS